MKARLFRARLVFEGAIDEVPDNPMAPEVFGISDAGVTAHASPCVTSTPEDKHKGGTRGTIQIAGLSDAEGKVLSINLNVYDSKGEWLSAFNASLSEEDVHKLGAAADAVLELVPEAPNEG